MTQKKTQHSVHIEGMTCANCAAGIQKHLTSKGLNDVSVNFAAQEANFSSSSLSIEEVMEEINSIGYKASVEEKEEEDNLIEKLFAICLVFTIPLFSHMFLPHDHFLQNPLVQIGLSLPVYLIGAYYFGKSAWGSLKTGVPNMDVLILMGSSSAFLYSLIGTLMHWGMPEAHHYLFFETTATIITLVLLGNVLEHRSVKQTTTAIKELSAIQQLKALKVLADGSTTPVSFKEIVQGDILLVNSGDKIPTDGELIKGEGIVDESMLSGENEPIHKKNGHKVIGGTIVVDGSFQMTATQVGKETVLSQIIELVKKAQNDKPSIQRLGDQVSAIFVPVVLGISLLTFLLSYFAFDIASHEALMRSIAVLVISCPCAMGLATPTAVMVGLGRAAKSGILIKGGNTLEEFAKVKNIVFDKTGTLTTGDFEIIAINCEDSQREEVKNILLSLETHSSHPIAKSMVKGLADSSLLELNKVVEHKGKGIAGQWNEDEYFLGSYATAKELTDDDGHQLYLLKNQKLLATVDIADEVKQNAKESIQGLKEAGLTPIMLSGDRQAKCESLAKELGIEKVYSQQLPQEKLEKINSFNQEAHTAMVGDGINDAPALAKAHVGVSLSSGTQIAIQSAQIVLLKGHDLSQVNEAHKISKHTLLTIKQNLFWAFSYNIVAIPIAALGFLNPMWGALFMAFSDVVVIGNSLRLKKKKI